MDAVVSLKAPEASLVDLGRTPAFGCGDMAVDPAARQIRGPERAVMLEPRVMQLLVALTEARGAVVSRDRLIARCWGDVVVGDDSLNRAIAGLRRGLVECGSRCVEVGTVPRVGYRLLVADSGQDSGPDAREAPVQGDGVRTVRPSRRKLMVALGVAGAGSLAGLAGWLLRGSGRAAAEARHGEAERHLLADRYGSEGKARGLLEPAVAADPLDARGWGLLAIAWQQIASGTVAETLPDAERKAQEAAGRALALDRLQGDAQAALALLDPAFGAWMAADERLQRVLEVVPGNGFAQQGMVNLLMASGRLADARRLAGTAGKAHPDSSAIRSAAVQLAWAEEGPAAALRLADSLGSERIRVAVLPWLLALAGRHAEGEAMMADLEAQQRVPSRVLRAQRLTARALGTGMLADRAAARDALLPIGTGGLAIFMAMGGLAGLGYVDDAYAMAERWYGAALGGGATPVGRALRHGTSTRILFLPITEAMRSDARFVPLCKRIGLVDYWRQRGARADAVKNRLLPL